MSSGHTLRVAQVAPLWSSVPPDTYGGIELLLALLCDGLVERGHEVTLFASGDSRTRAELRAVIPVNLITLMNRGDALSYEYYLNAAMAAVMDAHDDFDIVHCHLPPAWLPFASVLRKPCLFTLHTSLHPDDRWAMQEFPRARVAGISHAQVADVSARVGRQLPVVYNGVDFAAYSACFASGTYLAFLGRMSPEKNPLDAIRIARAAGMPLVLAGRPEGPKETEYFRKHVEPLIDGGSVRWIGVVNHMQKVDLLRNAAALLFPIQWDEPFGLVMVEAMACGTPVVATGRGSVPEIVDEGVTGYTGGSPETMIPLVKKACALDRERVREHAQRRFTHDRMVDEYVALYRA